MNKKDIDVMWKEAENKVKSRDEYFADGKREAFERRSNNRFNFNLLLSVAMLFVTYLYVKEYMWIAAWPIVAGPLLYILGNFTDLTVFPVDKQIPKARASLKNFVIFFTCASAVILLIVNL